MGACVFGTAARWLFRGAAVLLPAAGVGPFRGAVESVAAGDETVGAGELVGAGGELTAGFGVADGVVGCLLVLVAAGVVFAFSVVSAVTGASGEGVKVCVVLAAEGVVVAAEGVVPPGDGDAALTGAFVIRGAASIRDPFGGSSGVGTEPPHAGPASMPATAVAHAATRIPLRRSVLRRDDVLVDIRPSLFR